MPPRAIFFAFGGALVAVSMADLTRGDLFPAVPVALTGLTLIGLPCASTAWRERIVAVLVSAVFSVLLLEVAVRASGLSPLDIAGWGSGPLRSDPLVHHGYLPGVTFTREPGPYDEFGPVENRVNSLGMRGPEPPEAGADVLLLGDSFIQADQVPWGQTVQRRLAEDLERRETPETVLAHGIASWSPLLEWNWFYHVGGRFKPRLVFLFVLWNDVLLPSETRGFGTDEVYRRQAAFDAAGRPTFRGPYHPSEAGRTPLAWVRGHLEVADVVVAALDRFNLLRPGGSADLVRGDRSSVPGSAPDRVGTSPLRYEEIWREIGRPRVLGPSESEALLSVDSASFERSVGSYGLYLPGFWRNQRPWARWEPRRRKVAERSAGYIARLADDVRDAGGRLVLVYVPHPWQIGPEECAVGRYRFNIGDGVRLPAHSGFQEWLERTAKKERLPLIDPVDRFRAASAPGLEPLYLRWNCHWSPRGHAVMAEVLADWIVQHG